MVSCSHAWYLYGRWAPVECDLCWGRVILIQTFLFECQINFMNHKTCPDCRLMILHYTLLFSVNCWVRTKSLHFSPPSPREDRYLFSFDMFILIIQFPSGCCPLLCHVGNQLTQLSHYPRTQQYPSYSLRRLFMMSIQKNAKFTRLFLLNSHRSYTCFAVDIISLNRISSCFHTTRPEQT